jgi:restriction endonuclease S subunit
MQDGIDILTAGQDIEALRRVLVIAILGHYATAPASGRAASTNNPACALSILLSQLRTVPVASVASIVKGKTGIMDARPGGFPLVVTAEARASTDHFDFEGPGVIIPTVSSTGHGDASLKRIHYQEGQYAVGSILAVLQPTDATVLSAKYLHAYLSAFKEELLVSRMVGTANVSLTVAKIGTVPVPLLPIEQQRKISALMTLCDRLEAKQAAGEYAQAVLVKTLLGTLTQSTDAADFKSNWQRVAEHFDALFTTDSSLNALNQTILQLAVMGKVVPQDPNDEPASALLRQIAEKRDQLVSRGKPKAPTSFNHIGKDDSVFPVPAGWEWVKFGSVVELINGDRSKNYPNREEYAAAGVPWINTGHIRPDGTLAREGMHFITEEKFDSLRSGKIGPDDLVYCLRGATFGKTAFVAPYSKGAIASSLVIVRPFLPALKEFIYLYLISPFGRSQIFRFDNGSAQPNLSANSVTLYAFPLPPLAEQRRIVAKVNELMAICHSIKADLAQSRRQQERLASALIESAVEAA